MLEFVGREIDHVKQIKAVQEITEEDSVSVFQTIHMYVEVTK